MKLATVQSATTVRLEGATTDSTVWRWCIPPMAIGSLVTVETFGTQLVVLSAARVSSSLSGLWAPPSGWTLGASSAARRSGGGVYLRGEATPTSSITIAAGGYLDFGTLVAAWRPAMQTYGAWAAAWLAANGAGTLMVDSSGGMTLISPTAVTITPSASLRWSASWID